MNRAEAAIAFQAGRLHPHCPSCTWHHGLQSIGTHVIATVFWRLYRCPRCGETFKAAIEMARTQ